MVNFNFTTFKK